MANGKLIRTIFLKETRERLRNRLGLVINYGLPMLAYPMLLVFFGEAQLVKQANQKRDGLKIAIAGEAFPSLDKKLRAVHGSDVVRLSDSAAALAEKLAQKSFEIGPRTPDEAESPVGPSLRKLLKEQGLALLVYTRRAPYGTGKKLDNREVHLFYDRTREPSVKLMQSVDEETDAVRYELRLERMREAGLPGEAAFPIRIYDTDTAGEGKAAKEALAGVLPYLIFMFLSLATFYPALEVFSKERDRGTLISLLSTPVPPEEIIVAKTGSILFSVLLSIASHVTSLWLLTLALARLPDTQPFTMGQLQLPVVIPVILSAAILLAAAALCAITFAKSKEEGQGILSLMLIVTLAPVLFSSAADLKVSVGAMFIPLLNVALLLKESVREPLNGWLALGAGGVNLAAAYAVHSFTVHLFSQETVQFRGEYAAADLLSLRRDSIRESGALLSCLLFVALLVPTAYLSLFLAAESPLVTLPLLQLVCFLGIPCAVASYYRLNIRETFSLEKPSARNLYAAVLLGVSAPLVVAGAAHLSPTLEGVGAEMAKAMGLSGSGKTPWAMLPVLSLLPAVCEEMAFRGIIQGGLMKRLSPFWAITVTSIFFGLAHFSVFRFLPTALTGVLLGYVVWRGRSLSLSMTVHALYNASLFLYSSGWEPPLWTAAIGAAGIALGLATLKSAEPAEASAPVRSEAA